MTILFYTQWEYRIWITVSIVLCSLIGKDFTFLMSSFWIGWTVSKVPDRRTDVILKQLGVILLVTLAGTIIGYKFSLVHWLEVSGWI